MIPPTRLERLVDWTIAILQPLFQTLYIVTRLPAYLVDQHYPRHRPERPVPGARSGATGQGGPSRP